ncbi:MAG: prepilin-type N-terminal cleavage/methylation domain-containing protein, partial [Candidatus Falkowbacteria bacterium]|nr:prepilin-type N-terminal cleavage/methylation domain-containing protein [Candidatus Falkowbacteria bacterium]
MKNFIRQQNSGFSLIEIMVIISIVLVGMIGVLSLLVQNIQAQSINKNRFIAYQLAQEGIEVTRALRDNYAVNPGLTFLSGYPYGSYRCSYEESKGLAPLVGGTYETAVCINTGGYYDDYLGCPDPTHPNTIFQRVVQLSSGTDNQGDTFMKVTSTVSWS